MKDDTKRNFLEAYELHADAIYRHCFFRVFRAQQADDLMQETFMKMWVYLTQGNKIDNMRAFLYKIANNLIIDNARKKKEGQLDYLLETSHIKEPSYAGHQSIENQAILSQVKERIQELSVEDRQLITMRYIDDLDPKDIAEMLGSTPNNISVKLHRAVDKLQKHINLDPHSQNTVIRDGIMRQST